jgi:arsenate reductase-like glutaredoxin family protein
MGVELHELDITRQPPSRDFLEKHVDGDRFLDFVSTRSPVFRKRPLPRTKREAIDLMMKDPNLIRRPILIRKSGVVFGFDKERFQNG